MSHRTLVDFGWRSECLIDTDDLPKLLDILNGAHRPDYGYVGDERVAYLRDEDMFVEYRPAPQEMYISETEYKQRLEAYEKAQEEESNAEAING